MSLYNRSSLIQVPSLYKDGTLVSTIPEDRSGDFTVVRGSNLSATRVGEDGYIKKGYENLLLHSNDFSQWTTNGIDETSGQEGYDGSNDAWLIEKTNVSTRLERSISYTGVSTFSVYAKAGTLNWISLNASNVAKYYDLENGVLGTTFGTASMRIDFQIESVGNGWYRCSMTTNQTIGIVRIYPANVNGDTSGTSGSIYIQDAMLNEGLVAYPYLETTTAPVQGGLLENSPRLDWSNGVPAVLVEEGRTNFILQSECINSSGGWSGLNTEVNSIDSPEGLTNGTKVIIGSNQYGELRSPVILQSATTYALSLFVKAGDLGWCIVQYSDSTISNYIRVWFNISTGAVGSNAQVGWSIVGTPTIEAVGTDGWYRCNIVLTTTATSTNRAVMFGATGDSSFGATENSYFYTYGFQLEAGSTPSSYIPTYGTTQTRSSETISDNFNIPTTATIYNSFYSDVAETVFVLDQVFNVVVGLNKVAIAFSPTAVKISVGGSIVANATGTYDTSSLTNIQLGSDNGSDYSNAPISGFYVFPEFLTDEELNSLTD